MVAYLLAKQNVSVRIWVAAFMELTFVGFYCCEQCYDTWGHFTYGNFSTDTQYWEYIDSEQIEEATDKFRKELLEFANKNNLVLIEDYYFDNWKFIEKIGP